MSRGESGTRLRLSGVAGVVGGLGWAVLVATVGRGANVLGYGTLDPLTPVAFALTAIGVVGYRTRTEAVGGRFVTVAFGVFVAGLVGAVVGSAVYVVADVLAGWTVSVWAYLLALVGATGFGTGLLWDGIPPRSGAALLAGIPVGLAMSFGLAVAVGDEAVVLVGPAVSLGLGVAALGWWTWNETEENPS